MLYIVPTPIGNLEDFTFRAVRILNEVDILYSEDTRNSSKLLNYYNIKTSLKSYHIFNEHKICLNIIAELKLGKKIALISDAGTPSISDPGYLLIREAIKNNIRIQCLPGATAFVPAIVNSGFPTEKFVFEGFLPHKKGRISRLTELKFEKRTIIIYESPHRLNKLLSQLVEIFGGQRLISISRELTKIYEETLYGTIFELESHFNSHKVKGEIVVVLKGYEQ